MTKNAYIHIPFCSKKCHYCSFVSFNKLQKKTQYLNSLAKEISNNYKGEKLDTLYIGGGTPSLLSADEIAGIVELFSFENEAEITIEVNPNRLQTQYLKKLFELGINRISIGAQTFDNESLMEIGRLHNSEDIKSSVLCAREAGFKNISLDLIYGLPGQSLADFEYSLNAAASLKVEHISLYGLKIEEGSYFYLNEPNNLADDDLQADMYLFAGNFLRKNGYQKYEISNFSKMGFASRHNINYWNANTYYGFGCSAHGYEDGVRYQNCADLDIYIENPIQKPYKSVLTDKEKLEETIFLGLRKTEGINLCDIKTQFGYDLKKEKNNAIAEFVESGHLVARGECLAFSDEGFLLSNYILARII